MASNSYAAQCRGNSSFRTQRRRWQAGKSSPQVACGFRLLRSLSSTLPRWLWSKTTLTLPSPLFCSTTRTSGLRNAWVLAAVMLATQLVVATTPGPWFWHLSSLAPPPKPAATTTRCSLRIGQTANGLRRP